jgi:spore coat protein U-like protein
MKTVSFILVLCLPLSAQAACSVSTSDFAFGPYSPMNYAPLDQTGNLAVSCDGTAGQLISYTLALGSGSSGSFASRKMLYGNYALNYNMYLNAQRTTVWGDGNVGTGILTDNYSSVTGMNVKNYTLYGRIPGAQPVPPGPYRDALSITLTY